MVACAKWGLSARYVGKIGDDQAGTLQQAEMVRAGVESHWITVPDCPSLYPSSWSMGERESGRLLWHAIPVSNTPPRDSEGVGRAVEAPSRDGHDCAAAAAAARWAREMNIPVTADVDNLYPGVEDLLENVDYLISSTSSRAIDQ